jgi:integrase
VSEAEALIEALPAGDRTLWATAFYAGVRLGELRALRWGDLDLAAGRIEVRRSWDPEAGEIEPKSDAGRRRVPIAALLRERLIEHRLRSDGAGLVFGRGEVPFAPNTISRRAKRTWQRAGLDPITLHSCRHTAASYLIASGVNLKAVSVFMGHANISITLDRYGHLLPGSVDEGAELLDA